MTWETAFDDLMADEVERHPYSSRDVHGQRSYGSPVTLKCRVVYKPTLVRTGGSGEVTEAVREHVSNSTIYCSGIVGWNLKDKIVLPDGTSPTILQIVVYPDEDGPHHEVVYV